jgi:hypothetical protein
MRNEHIIGGPVIHYPNSQGAFQRYELAGRYLRNEKLTRETTMRLGYL